MVNKIPLMPLTNEELLDFVRMVKTGEWEIEAHPPVDMQKYTRYRIISSSLECESGLTLEVATWNISLSMAIKEALQKSQGGDDGN